MSNSLKELINYSQTLNVLFVEDNKEVKAQLTKLLHNFFLHLDSCNDGEEALNKFEDFKTKTGSYYDLIITDISMPKIDGIEFSRILIEKNPNQLIIIVSAHTESEKLLDLIDIGIYKFLEKPVVYSDLLETLTAAISKVKREKTFFELQEKVKVFKNDNLILNKLALTDKLTNVYNRRFIDNKLYESFEKLDSYRQRDLSVIFIDLDNFKCINDNYGHITGDKILVEFSNLIKRNIRADEVLGRWGGEEFIIICDNLETQKALKLAEKIRIIIEKHHFVEVDNLTASFGVASYKSDDTIQSLIHKADTNLYKAKSSGKNRVF